MGGYGASASELNITYTGIGGYGASASASVNLKFQIMQNRILKTLYMYNKD